MVNINFVYIGCALIFQICSSVFIKIAAAGIQNGKYISSFLSPFYFLAILCLAFQAVAWQKVLQRYPLYYAYTWNSFVYIGLLLSGFIIFKEKISFLNLAGTILIITGLIIVSFAKKEKKI